MPSDLQTFIGRSKSEEDLWRHTPRSAEPERTLWHLIHHAPRSKTSVKRLVPASKLSWGVGGGSSSPSPLSFPTSYYLGELASRFIYLFLARKEGGEGRVKNRIVSSVEWSWKPRKTFPLGMSTTLKASNNWTYLLSFLFRVRVGPVKELCSKWIPLRVNLVSAWGYISKTSQKPNSRTFLLICLFGGGGVVIKSWIVRSIKCSGVKLETQANIFFQECLAPFKLPIVGFTCFQFSFMLRCKNTL